MNISEFYDLHDLSPESFLEHSKKFEIDEDLAIQYRNAKFLDGPGAGSLDEECDAACKRMFFCETTANDYDQS